MEITIETNPDSSAIVRLNGRLDFVSAASVRQRIVESVEEGYRRVVVDLGNVPFIDSSGLGALIGGLKAARIAGGDLRIARVGEQANMVLKLTSLDRVFAQYDTVEAALSSMSVQAV